MTTPAANQPGSARPQSSAKSSESSEEERVKLLKELVGLLSRATGSEPNDPSVQSLAGLLADILKEVIQPEDVDDFIKIDTRMQELLKKLLSKKIEINSKVVSFDGANVGDVSIGDVAGGNITKISLTTSSYVSDVFSNIDSNEYARYKAPKFAVPQHAGDWISILDGEQMLVIHGNEQYDEDELGRYVALRFAAENPDPQGDPLPVLQWVRSAPVRDVNAILAQQQKPAVFVLTQVSRDVHGADFFYKLKQQQQHFLVVTSDVSFTGWQLPASDQKKWVDLTQGQVYTADVLTNKLVADLNDRSKHPTWCRFLATPKISANNTIGGESLRAIASKLETPKRCELFVQLLYKEFIRVGGEHTQKFIKRDGINTLIVTIKDDDRGLHIWYHSLSAREQYMVIALTCLNEMRDNQFFAALDKVVARAWRRRSRPLASQG